MKHISFKQLLPILIMIFATISIWACTETGDNTDIKDEPKIVYGNIVDVVSRKIYHGKITICSGKIADIQEVGADECKEQVFILPGFIDAHIHIESTLMTPQNYARMAIANGVIAAVCDPHEIANVLGVEGIEFMISD